VKLYYLLKKLTINGLKKPMYVEDKAICIGITFCSIFPSLYLVLIKALKYLAPGAKKEMGPLLY